MCPIQTTAPSPTPHVSHVPISITGVSELTLVLELQTPLVPM